jgi:hypothetical protein
MRRVRLNPARRFLALCAIATVQPTRKDIAEFFRLGLLAGVCEPALVAQWAESIVAADLHPHIAFIELCISGSQSTGIIQRLLADVPNQATPDLPVRMLLGHASRLVATHIFSPEELLLRLYRIANLETFPEHIYFEFVRLEDDLSLAQDRAYTVSQD